MTNMNFEETMLKLENEVKKLESGNMTLDDSIAAYEEAIKLIGICNKKLDEAEHRVRILTETSDGCITDMPFDLKDET